MSYSEGPWSVEANAYGTIFVYGSKTYGTPSGFRYRELICGGDSYKTLTPDNAALIGAAPELLECLKEARRLLTDQDAIDLAHIDEVIAKASTCRNNSQSMTSEQQRG